MTAASRGIANASQCRSDGRLDRQRVNRDFLEPARRRHALLGAAKIECVLEAKAAQHLDVGIGDVAEMVGSEYPPPADGAAVFRRIAPKVAKIAGAGKIEVTGGVSDIKLILSHPLRRDNA